MAATVARRRAYGAGFALVLCGLSLGRWRGSESPSFAVRPPHRLAGIPKLQHRAHTVARAAGSREEVKTSLFDCLDVNRDGLLASAELRRFAESTGFDGSEADWAEEYAFLCGSLGCEAAAGLDMAAFSRLVDDTSDEGCYCSDEELAAMLTSQSAAGGGTSVAGGSQPTPSAPTVSVRGTAGMEYFEEERRKGLYEGSWKAWDPSEGLSARSPRVGSIPALAGCDPAATPQEAVMFLYDQVQGGIFGDATQSVQDRIGQILGLATSGSDSSGWFDLRLDESAVGEKELAELVLSPQGWPTEKGAIPNGYMMHILSVGRGVKSTLCGRENNHIINALHRDVSKCGQLCDTCLCGVIGRKRVILFAPHEFRETSGWARKPDLTSHDLLSLTYLPEQEAWTKLEALASSSSVVGGVTTLEPGRFVFVPHGWWHAVQPVDGFTFITGPSRLSGLAAQS